MIEDGTARPPGRSPRRSSGSTYWLIEKDENGPMEVLTIDLASGEEALPVFSFREEAEMFLGFEAASYDWWVRESRAGEIVSMLYGPCAGVGKVALDPLPEITLERTVGFFVSLGRERFVDYITAREEASDSAVRIRDRGDKEATEVGRERWTGSTPETG